MVTSPGVQNGDKCQQVEPIADHSKKLLDDLHELGQKIKHHENNVKYLKTLKSNLEKSILDMQGFCLSIWAWKPCEQWFARHMKVSKPWKHTTGKVELTKISAFMDLHLLLADRFLVICLEDIRPYVGEFVADDPQGRLSLLKPRLSNGETPSGFLGFAVNMVTMDRRNLYCTPKNGDGLRETLFYHLFSNLQVYKSREDMVKALTCIRNGAISLDGGMIRSPGVFSLGKHEKDIDLKFPTSSEKFSVPESYLETENGIKRDRTSEDMKREQDLITRARFNCEKKKQELLQFIAKSSPNLPQFPVGCGSTPR